jgi:hypothetical protein
MSIEPLISHTGILMTFYLSIILDLQNFFHWYILQSWKIKRNNRYSFVIKDTFKSHIDKQIFLTFLLTPYLYTFSLCENPSLIIFSAETEYISTRSWYRNKFSKYVQQYTSFSCIWCLHLAIDSLCKGQ